MFALCSVAILWPEMWHSALEDASRLYFGEDNIPGMISTVLPLHDVSKFLDAVVCTFIIYCVSMLCLLVIVIAFKV